MGKFCTTQSNRNHDGRLQRVEPPGRVFGCIPLRADLTIMGAHTRACGADHTNDWSCPVLVDGSSTGIEAARLEFLWKLTGDR